mmetsp:Transcript_29185/g.63916  ORF Transcript_29185/g.63916 Transcript_29185/m.63916 type:complete len:492 (-) Transcript_29185:235-1710(-)
MTSTALGALCDRPHGCSSSLFPVSRVPTQFEVYSGFGQQRRKVWPPDKPSRQATPASHVLHLAKMLQVMSESDELCALDTALYELTRQLHGSNNPQAQLLETIRVRYLSLVQALSGKLAQAERRLKGAQEGEGVAVGSGIDTDVSTHATGLQETAASPMKQTSIDSSLNQQSLGDLAAASPSSGESASFDAMPGVRINSSSCHVIGRNNSSSKHELSMGSPAGDDFCAASREAYTSCRGEANATAESVLIGRMASGASASPDELADCAREVDEADVVDESQLSYAEIAERRLRALSRIEKRAAAEEAKRSAHEAAVQARAQRVAEAHMRAVAALVPEESDFEKEKLKVRQLSRLRRSVAQIRQASSRNGGTTPALVPDQPTVADVAANGDASFVFELDALDVAVRLSLQLKSDEDGEYSTGVRMSLSRGLLPVDSDLSAVADAEGQARLEVGRAMVAADSWTVRVVNSGERNATFALELKTVRTLPDFEQE